MSYPIAVPSIGRVGGGGLREEIPSLEMDNLQASLGTPSMKSVILVNHEGIAERQVGRRWRRIVSVDEQH